MNVFARRDARYFQILFQALFLFYGHYFLHWQSEWWLYLTYFSTSVIVQLAAEIIAGFAAKSSLPEQWQSRFTRSLPSICISSFGLSLLLKTNSIQVAIFAATVSVISKFIFKSGKKHIFNPSAFGIVAAIGLTGNAWISPAQWGNGMVILFTVLVLGSIIVTKVQKLDLTIAFLGSFILLLFGRQVIYLGWHFDFFLQSISTGSLLLFSFFMITDPKTTPSHPAARMLWGVAVGIAAFYLQSFRFMSAAPVFALVCLQPFVPLLDRVFKASAFEWMPRPRLFRISTGNASNAKPVYQDMNR